MSVYASRLSEAGNEVVLLARGGRLTELRNHGLVVEEAESGRRDSAAVTVVDAVPCGDPFGLVLVPVRSDQLSSTLEVLTAMQDRSPVLFFGNTAGHQVELTTALGDRVLFGFPAVGGLRVGAAIRFVLIGRQKTMLGERSGRRTPRVRELCALLEAAGFPTRISASMADWLTAHAAFVVPMAFALYRDGTDPAVLAADRGTLRVVVRATRQAFRTLRSRGNTEIPASLNVLYRWVPTPLVVGYWRRVLAAPAGGLWFAAHSRAAPEEMRAMADDLRQAMRSGANATPDLDDLLG